MLIYLIFISLLFALNFLSLDKKLQRLGTLLFFILYIFFVGFRFETGFDWLTYRDEFNAINFDNNFWNEIVDTAKEYKHEPFYVFSIYIIKFIFRDFFFVIFFTSLFLYYSYKQLATTFKINVNSLVFIILLFSLFTVHFSVIRQSIALSCFNLAIVAWQNKRKKKIYIFLLLSFLFHFSSIIYISLLLLSILLSKVKSTATLLKIYFSTFFIGFILPRIITFDNSTRIGNKINHYLNYDTTGNLGEIVFNLVLYFGVLIFLYSLRKKVSKNLNWMTHFINLSVLFSLIFFTINPIRNRIFYELCTIISVYFLIFKKSHYWYRDFKMMFLNSLGAILFMASILKFYSISFIPYQSYFQLWIFNDSGNGEARQEFIHYKAYRDELYKAKAKKEGKLKEYYKMVDKLKRDANIK